MRSVRFVGMDVHKETINIAVLRDGQRGAEIEFEPLRIRWHECIVGTEDP